MTAFTSRSPFIAHHGVKGMKWGVWNSETRSRYFSRDQAYENVANSRTSNLDKWGKDPDHNIMYVTGYSGSGKTGTVERLRDNNTNVIHLDFYLEGGNSRYAKPMRDNDFDKYLKGHPSAFDSYDPRSQKENRWKSLDAFEAQLEAFGKEQYKSGKKVIVEGVQILDNTLYPDKSHFNGKPVMILGTDLNTSSKRANERDGIEDDDIDTVRIRQNMQNMWSTKIKDLEKIADVKAGKEYVEDILKRI